MNKQTEWFSHRTLINLLALIGVLAILTNALESVSSYLKNKQDEITMDQKLEGMITNLDIIQNDLNEINQSLDRITVSFKHRSDNSQQEFFNLVERMMDRADRDGELGK